MHINILEDQYIWSRSPVRLDLAGGWTDTPPYTFKCGGKVVNLAVELNDELPVQTYIRRDPKNRIKISSIDLGITEEINTLAQLDNHRDPKSPFGIVRASLHFLGFNYGRYGRLRSCLAEIGGGFDITTFVSVPKGSGLGVSSILTATVLGAFHRLLGLKTTADILCNEVLAVEQMLTTGGGWQDQIGGMIGGVKYAISQPAEDQVNPVVEKLDDYLFTDPEYRRCFTLYYTGINRLAHDILKKVVQRVNQGDAEYLRLHQEIGNLANEARLAISQRNLEKLISIVAESWEANQRIDPTVTNGDIRTLLQETSDLYGSAKLLGAGGGGYCLFVSKDPEQGDQLRAKLKNRVYGNSRLVDWKLNTSGLRVSVS